MKKIFTIIITLTLILTNIVNINASNKKTIFISAGHQKYGISSKEYIAYGSKKKKAKLSTGTVGVKTKIPEYKTNLAISKVLRDELVKRGYKVIMLRTTNNCPLSNKQRTLKANKSGANIHICIHCNGGSKKDIGPLVCLPKNSKYVGKKIYSKSNRLGKLLLSSTCKSIKKKSHGIIKSNNYTTINYSKIPTIIFECGFLSNPKEDKQLNSKRYQKKLAKGLANGIDKYFK